MPNDSGSTIHRPYLVQQRPMTATTGPLISRDDIPSTRAPFHAFPGYKVTYPPVVIKALGLLFMEFNRTLTPLVEANAEWDTDYGYCTVGGYHRSGWVQIDAVGLTDELLHDLAHRDLGYVVEVLRRLIYEVENSLAMYPLLRELFPDSPFKGRFQASLEQVSARHGMPVALLAVTQEKYADMMRTEFGREPGDPLSDAEVQRLTGFDTFFGPERFADYVASRNGGCGHLLYVRSSPPPEELKRPNKKVAQPLLGDPEMRRLIRQFSLTPNIDLPGAPSSKSINDTKLYMGPMGMAFHVSNFAELVADGLERHLASSGTIEDFAEKYGTPFSPNFAQFLRDHGVEESYILSGVAPLHAKPGGEAFGCFGHCGGVISDRGFRDDLRNGLKRRAVPYVVQPHFPPALLVENKHGRRFLFGDRLFLYHGPDDAQPEFLGGFRCMTPEDSEEGKKGHIHGGKDTRWGSIVD